MLAQWRHERIIGGRPTIASGIPEVQGSWMNLGPALHLGGGYYRFTDLGAAGQAQRYYLLRKQ